MRRQFSLILPARYRRHDCGRAVFIPHIVLYHEYGANAALLASDYGIQIRVIDFVSLYIFHIVSSFYVNDGLVRIEQVRLFVKSIEMRSRTSDICIQHDIAYRSCGKFTRKRLS